MTIFQSLILGIVQGITEFLPISSSAHLVLIPYFFKWDIAEEFIFPFDVLVQMGTLIAVIIYFRQDLISIIRCFFRDIKNKQPFHSNESRLGLLIIIATIPAGAIGYFLDDVVEQAFQNPMLTAFFLLVTAGLMLLSEKFSKKEKDLSDMSTIDALWIGFFQLMAIFPGISRSGATISGGLFKNFKRETAARFSFLISIPIMLAAGLKSMLDLNQISQINEFLPIMAIGFITSAIVGYVSIAWLLKFLNKNRINIFSYYCILLALATFLINYAK
ncbi:MAG: undecaprenyl-diphosphatase UppP [Anaerolineaceae bacterium]|nr:undecaprenyl-diphosphatase UppP [Anaerolineaceae bacterium]